mgnify:CR=1 FL=1
MVHVVQSGDSLWAISRSYGVDISELLAWNRLSNSSKIFVGSRIIVSAERQAPIALAEGGVHVVRSGDTLWSISRSRGVTVTQLRRWNRLGGGDILRPGDKLRVEPVAD